MPQERRHGHVRRHSHLAQPKILGCGDPRFADDVDPVCFWLIVAHGLRLCALCGKFVVSVWCYRTNLGAVVDSNDHITDDFWRRLFLDFLFLDEAKRPATKRGYHPREPLRGKFVRYHLPAKWLRGSDFSERKLVAVKVLCTIDGQNVLQACNTLTSKLQHRLGKSCRGRPRTRALFFPPGFRGARHNLEASYYGIQRRHPFRVEQLVESWLTRFWFWKGWLDGFIRKKMRKSFRAGLRGRLFFDDLMQQDLMQHGYAGQITYESLACLGEEWLTYALVGKPLKERGVTVGFACSRGSAKELERAKTFVGDFLNTGRSNAQKGEQAS